jgi:hypothetical protein
MALNRSFEYLFGEHETRTVRESVAKPVKFIPLDVTLSTANTAQDLINLETQLHPALNLVTNPSIETAGTPPAGWTATGATVTRVTTTPRTGTYSMSVNADNSAANEGAYFQIDNVPPGYYACSAYLRHPAAGGTARVRASSDGGSTFSTGNTVTMADNWNGRSTVLHQVTQDQTTIRIYVTTVTQQNITFLVDDVQVEPAWNIVLGAASVRENPPAATVTSFVDPITDRFARFLGTTDASESIREPSIGEIHHISLYSSHAAYLDFDRTVAIRTATPLGYYLGAGIDYRINLDKIVKSKISFVNAAGTETPKVTGYVTGF